MASKKQHITLQEDSQAQEQQEQPKQEHISEQPNTQMEQENAPIEDKQDSNKEVKTTVEQGTVKQTIKLESQTIVKPDANTIAQQEVKAIVRRHNQHILMLFTSLILLIIILLLYAGEMLDYKNHPVNPMDESNATLQFETDCNYACNINTLQSLQWKEVQTLPTKNGLYLTFNHDQSRIAVAEQKVIQQLVKSPNGAWEYDTQSLIGHSYYIYQVKYNHNSTIIASCSDDKQIYIWKMQTDGKWRISDKLYGHKKTIYTISFNNDSTLLASGSLDKTIRIYNNSNGTWVFQQVLKQHNGTVQSVTFNNDSTLMASGSADNTIIIWALDDNNQWIMKQQLTGHSGIVWNVAFNKDSTVLISCSQDHTIIIWKQGILKDWVVYQVLRGHSESVDTVTFSNNLIVSGSYDMTIRVWQLNLSNLWECVSLLDDNIHQNYIYSALVDNNNTMISASADQTIKIRQLIE